METEDKKIVTEEPKENKGDPVKPKVAERLIRKGIENDIKKAVRAGQDRQLAKSLAYIKARKVAIKTLGYIPKGFYKDKD